MQQLEPRSRSFLPRPTTNRLFTGLTAWFSNSIPQSVKDTWFLSGGELETKEEADFILSSSFSWIDVRKVKSRYPVAVLHGDWVVQSSKEGKILSITSYLLLPDCLKDTTLGNDVKYFSCWDKQLTRKLSSHDSTHATSSSWMIFPLELLILV